VKRSQKTTSSAGVPVGRTGSTDQGLPNWVGKNAEGWSPGLRGERVRAEDWRSRTCLAGGVAKKAVADPFRLEDSISLEPRRNCLLAEIHIMAFEGICS